MGLSGVNHSFLPGILIVADQWALLMENNCELGYLIFIRIPQTGLSQWRNDLVLSQESSTSLWEGGWDFSS